MGFSDQLIATTAAIAKRHDNVLGPLVPPDRQGSNNLVNSGLMM